MTRTSADWASKLSLIHTVELCEGNPVDYLVALLRHPEALARAPGEWMPWNYQQALASADASSAN
ncbi:hypothetical protein [Myxococcus vastator]|uniref:hypothetical protein n=1 Tax=Myxococcus vastator TaxID=2709664 RepID=UPI0013D0D497|nr:hypothetical protein [Myxococcus vastator]